MLRLTRNEMARRLAMDISDGSYVNLGVGIPTLVANYLPPDREIILHSENGILGMGPAPADPDIDEDLINAGKKPVTLLQGGAFFDQSTSFGMIRGRHLDLCVLGAYQVAANGDLANWNAGAPSSIPAVGGAMDLAVGAKNVFVLMTHHTREGQSKIVRQCTYPLTGQHCVTRIYTDLAQIAVTPAGLTVREIYSDIDFDHLQTLTDAPLIDGRLS